MHLVFITDGTVLETTSAVNADLTVSRASQDDWGSFHELHHSLWSSDLVAVSILVFVLQLRAKRIPLQVPNFNSTIVGYRGEDGRGVLRPADVIHLLSQVSNLMANKLAVTVLLVPDPDSPVIGAGQEHRAVVGVPEWVAAHAVDWSHVAIVVV